MKDEHRESGRVAAVTEWRLVSWVSWVSSCMAVVVAAGCAGTQKKAGDAPKGASPPGYEQSESALHEEPHAAPAPSDEAARVVSFIRSNAATRQEAARACRQMTLCTDFQPADRGGEQGMILSIPEDAKECLQSRNPECEAALDEIAKLSPPTPIRADYMKWAHDASELELERSRLALDLMEREKLKVKKQGNGYQDFWAVWAAEHFPSESEKAQHMNAQAESIQTEGAENLERWLADHHVCRERSACTPEAVETGKGLTNRFADAP